MRGEKPDLPVFRAFTSSSTPIVAEVVQNTHDFRAPTTILHITTQCRTDLCPKRTMVERASVLGEAVPETENGPEAAADQIP